MVGRKGQGVCSCIVFPAAGEKDLPELPLAVIDGVAGEGPAQLLPPNGFSKEEGQIPGRQVFLKMAVWEGDGGGNFVAAGAVLQLRQVEGRTGGRGGSGGLGRGHGGSFHLLLRCGAGASSQPKAQGHQAAGGTGGQGKGPTTVSSLGLQPQKLLVQRQRGSLSVKIIGILAHVDSPSKSSFSLALALASRERTELGDRPRMDAISSVEYPS